MTGEAEDLLTMDIRSGTRNVYTARFNHFRTYCDSIGVDPQHCSENVVVNFLTMLKTKFGYKYQTIAGYRSAISKYHDGIHGVPIGQAKHVKRVTKAVFNVSPPIAKYANIWPVDKLLVFLGTLYPHEDLTVSQLGMKCLSLISLTSVSRSSTVALLGPDMQVLGDEFVFSICGLEKTSRQGHLRRELRCPLDSSNPALDVHLCCEDYLSRTEERRVYYAAGEGQRPNRLFISSNKVCFLVYFLCMILFCTFQPFQPVKSCTLAKWMLSAMESAGIDTASYKAHSARAASSSAMLSKGLSLGQILSRADWSRARTFYTFYNKET